MSARRTDTRLSRRRFLAGGLALAATAPLPAVAASADPRIDQLFQVTSELFGVVPGLLNAIALQESGRKIGGTLQPWPWTLNVAGKGHLFDSHTDAWDGIARALDRRPLPGNIDVGMMQVSWPYNLPRLTDLYLALDPKENLRAAALVLRANYDRCRDWWQATGWYHSHRPARAARYSASVRRHYQRLAAAGLDGIG